MKYKLLPRGNSTAISNTQKTQKHYMDHLIKNLTLAKIRQLRRTKQLIRRLNLPIDITNDNNDFQPKKKLKSVSQKPQTDLLFTTCKVLYDDGV